MFDSREVVASLLVGANLKDNTSKTLTNDLKKALENIETNIDTIELDANVDGKAVKKEIKGLLTDINKMLSGSLKDVDVSKYFVKLIDALSKVEGQSNDFKNALNDIKSELTGLQAVADKTNLAGNLNSRELSKVKKALNEVSNAEAKRADVQIETEKRLAKINAANVNKIKEKYKTEKQYQESLNSNRNSNVMKAVPNKDDRDKLPKDNNNEFVIGKKYSELLALQSTISKKLETPKTTQDVEKQLLYAKEFLAVSNEIKKVEKEMGANSTAMTKGMLTKVNEVDSRIEILSSRMSNIVSKEIEETVNKAKENVQNIIEEVNRSAAKRMQKKVGTDLNNDSEPSKPNSKDEIKDSDNKYKKYTDNLNKSAKFLSTIYDRSEKGLSISKELKLQYVEIYSILEKMGKLSLLNDDDGFYKDYLDYIIEENKSLQTVRNDILNSTNDNVNNSNNDKNKTDVSKYIVSANEAKSKAEELYNSGNAVSFVKNKAEVTDMIGYMQSYIKAGGQLTDFNTNMQNQFNKLTGETGNAKQELKDLCKEILNLDAATATVGNTGIVDDKFTQDLKNANIIINELKNTVTELTKELDDLKASQNLSAHSDEEVKDLNDKLSKAENDLKTNKQLLDTATASLSKFESGEITSDNYNTITADLAKATKQLEQLSVMVDNTKADLKEAKDEINGLQAELDAKIQLDEELALCKKELEDNKTKVLELNKQIKEATTNADLLRQSFVSAGDVIDTCVAKYNKFKNVDTFNLEALIPKQIEQWKNSNDIEHLNKASVYYGIYKKQGGTAQFKNSNGEVINDELESRFKELLKLKKEQKAVSLEELNTLNKELFALREKVESLQEANKLILNRKKELESELALEHKISLESEKRAKKAEKISKMDKDAFREQMSQAQKIQEKSENRPKAPNTINTIGSESNIKLDDSEIVNIKGNKVAVEVVPKLNPAEFIGTIEKQVDGHKVKVGVSQLSSEVSESSKQEEIKKTKNIVKQAYEAMGRDIDEYNAKYEKNREIIEDICDLISRIKSLNHKEISFLNLIDEADEHQAENIYEIANKVAKKMPSNKDGIKNFVNSSLKGYEVITKEEMAQTMSLFRDGYDSTTQKIFDGITSKTSKEKLLKLSQMSGNIKSEWKKVIDHLETSVKPQIKELMDSICADIGRPADIDYDLRNNFKDFKWIKDSESNFDGVESIKEYMNHNMRNYSKGFSIIDISDIDTVEKLRVKINELSDSCQRLAKQENEAKLAYFELDGHNDEAYEKHLTLQRQTEEAFKQKSAYERLLHSIEQTNDVKNTVGAEQKQKTIDTRKVDSSANVISSYAELSKVIEKVSMQLTELISRYDAVKLSTKEMSDGSIFNIDRIITKLKEINEIIETINVDKIKVSLPEDVLSNIENDLFDLKNIINNTTENLVLNPVNVELNPDIDIAKWTSLIKDALNNIKIQKIKIGLDATAVAQAKEKAKFANFEKHGIKGEIKESDLNKSSISNKNQDIPQYFSKVSNSVSAMSKAVTDKFIKKGFTDVAVAGVEELDGKVKKLKVTATDASGAIKDIVYGLVKVEGKKNPYLFAKDNVGVNVKKNTDNSMDHSFYLDEAEYIKKRNEAIEEGKRQQEEFLAKLKATKDQDLQNYYLEEAEYIRLRTQALEEGQKQQDEYNAKVKEIRDRDLQNYYLEEAEYIKKRNASLEEGKRQEEEYNAKIKKQNSLYDEEFALIQKIESFRKSLRGDESTEEKAKARVELRKLENKLLEKKNEILSTGFTNEKRELEIIELQNKYRQDAKAYGRSLENSNIKTHNNKQDLVDSNVNKLNDYSNTNNKVSSYSSTFADVSNKINDLNNKLLSGEMLLSDYRKEVNKLFKLLDSESFNTINETGKYVGNVVSQRDIKNIDEADKEIRKLLSNYKLLSDVKFNPKLGKWTAEIIDANGKVRTLEYSFEHASKSIRENITGIAQKTSLLGGFFDQLKGKWQEVLRYTLSFVSFYEVWAMIKNGVSIVKELDSAMIEMKKVSKDSQQALEDYAESSHRVAQSIGSTSVTLQNSAADWMRLGYSIDEASELAKNTAILMNVSEFEEIGEATESMVAMIQAFKQNGDDVADLSQELIDKLNNIGNNYAISTSDLAESLKRSSSSLIAAGNTIDEAIALTVAANNTTQDPESTGSALKVVSMRIRGTSAKALEDEGEDTEGLIETTSKLEEKVKELTAINGKMGVSLVDVNGNYRSTYEILCDIANIWEEIGQADIADGMNRQAALLELLAGKTRAQSLASLLQSKDDLVNAYADVQNSSGSAAQEQAKYMESIEAHINQLKASWQEVWSNTLSSDAINTVLDFADSVLVLVNRFGGLVPVLSVLAISFTVFKLRNTEILKTIAKTTLSVFSLGKEYKSLGGLMPAVTQKIGSGFKSLGTAIMTPMGSITFLIATIAGGIALYDALTDSTEELCEKAKDSYTEFQNTASELSDLNDQLKSAEARMKELNSIPNLTIMEQTELETLQATSAELERIIKAKQILADQQGQTSAEAAAKALTNDEQTANDFFSGYNTDDSILAQFEKAIKDYSASRYVQSINDENLKAIEEKYNNDSSLYTNDEMWKKYNESYKENSDKVKELETKVAGYSSQVLELGKQLFKSDGTAYEGVEETADKYKNLLDFYNIEFDKTGNYKNDKITEILSKDEYKNAESNIKNLAKSGELTKEYLVSNYSSLMDELSQIGIDYDEFIEHMVASVDPYGVEGKKSEIETILNPLKELIDLSKLGNVDLTIRPIVDSKTMQEAGYDVKDGDIATTFTSGEFVWQGDEKNGKYVYVHYTPILPNGKVLSQDEINAYINETLSGNNNVMAADNLGIVLKVDDIELPEKEIKDLQNGNGMSDNINKFLESANSWDNALHVAQEKFYSGNSDLNNIIREFINSGYTYSDLLNIDFEDDETSGAEKMLSRLLEGLELSKNSANALLEILLKMGLISQGEKNYSFKLSESDTKTVDNFQSKISLIQSTIEKIQAGSFTNSDLLDLMQTDGFSDVVNHVGDLEKYLTSIANEELDDVIEMFESMDLDESQLRTIRTTLSGIISDVNKLSSKDSFDKSLDSISQLDKDFSPLGNIYEQTTQKGFKSLDYDSIMNLEDTFGNFDSFNKFKDVAMDTTSSVSEIRNALNELATEYINNSDLLNNLTEENKGYAASELKKIGITNASAVVEDRLRLSTQLRTSALNELQTAGITSVQTTEQLTNASWNEIAAMAEQVRASGKNATALCDLAIQKININNNPITTDGDIKNMLQLLDTMSDSAKFMSRYEEIKANIARAGSPTEREGWTRELNSFLNLAKSKIGNGKNKNTIYSPKKITYKPSSGGSSSKSTSDTFSKEYDNIEREINNLQLRINNRLNLITETASYGTKENAHKQAMSYFKEQLSAYKKGASYYTKQRSKIKFSSKERSILNKVVYGDISISNVKDEKLANKIDEYMSLTDKINNANGSVIELNNSIKEQDQLIKELKIDSYKNSLSALEYTRNLYESQSENYELQGKTVTSGHYNKLISNSKSQIKNYETQNSLLKSQQKGLSKTSDKYQEIQREIESNNLAIQDAKNSQIEWNNKIANMNLEKIQKYLEYLDSIKTLNKSAFDLKVAKGTDLSSSDYSKLMTDNNNQIAQLKKEQSDYSSKISLAKKNGGYYGGKSTNEWQALYNQTLANINQIYIENEELKDSLRDDVYWRTYERAKQSLEAYQSKLSSLLSLLNDVDMFDDNGDITKFGAAKMALTISKMENAKSTIKATSSEIANLTSLYKKGYYTSQEYTELLNEKQNTLLQNANDLKTIQMEIIEIYKERGQAELDNLVELIKKRQDLINKQKEYYDYGKNMANKTKNIKALKQEIAALESLSNAQDKATQSRIRALKAELQEAQDDLSDTEYDHKINIITEGLDDLTVKLQETYDEYIDDLKNNLTGINSTVEEFAKLFSKSLSSAGKTIEELLKSYGVNPKDVGIDFSKLAGFSEGGLVKQIKKNGDTGLASLKAGEFVLNEELVKIFKCIIPTVDNLYNNLTKTSVPNKYIAKQQPSIINYNYDSLLHVDGNVDKNVLPELKEILRQSYEYNKQQDYNQNKKLGFRKKY